MANFSDKADEVVGRAKEAAGDLTGNDELKAEGAADKTRAQVKQGVDAAVDKAEEVAADVKEGVDEAVDKAADKPSELTDKASAQASELADRASDAAQQAGLNDKRVLVIAAIAGVTLTILVKRFRSTRNDGRATKRTVKRAAKKSAKRAGKRAAKSGLARALSN